MEISGFNICVKISWLWEFIVIWATEIFFLTMEIFKWWNLVEFSSGPLELQPKKAILGITAYNFLLGWPEPQPFATLVASLRAFLS